MGSYSVVNIGFQPEGDSVSHESAAPRNLLAITKHEGQNLALKACTYVQAESLLVPCFADDFQTNRFCSININSINLLQTREGLNEVGATFWLFSIERALAHENSG